MRLLLDQGLPRSAAEVLRGAGHDAVHLGEIGMASADDVEVLHHARQEGFTVVTLDADFHTLMALSGADKPSVIRVRTEGLRGSELAEVLLAVLESCQADLEAGALISVKEDRIRLRTLPLGE